MRSIGQLMAELRLARVRVWQDGERLRYQAPRGALGPDLLDELRARKAEILEFCRQATTGSSGGALEPRPREDGDFPISLSQQRLWILDRLEGSSEAYNIALALRLRGALNLDAMRWSLQALIRRHEPLRTAFRLHGDTVRQVINPAPPLPLAVVDLRDLPAGRRVSEARRQAGEEALRPFDLSRAPLVRFVLWQLESQDQLLLMVVHHIVSDGRSIEVLAEELGALYGARCDGRDAELPELRVQYADFAWHQRQWLKEDMLHSQLDYWKRRLAGLPPLLQLPTDRPRPPVLTSAGAMLKGTLGAGMANRLKQVARESGATPHMVLLAGIAVVLARCTGREDIVIGCPVSHRNRPELERLVGFFVNTLAFRIDLSGNPSFRELLARVRAVVTDGFANQDAPFDKVVEAIGGIRNPSYPPLVQVTVAMLDERKARAHLPGLETEPFDFGDPVARYDLSLEIYQSDTAIDIFWIYRTSLFERDTIARMARHLNNLVESAAADPDKAVSELNPLDQAELRELLQKFNNTYPRQATIGTPEGVAVRFGQADPKEVTLYELPGNDIEVRLAEIWAEMLGVDRIGRHDNFFELGGHSLLAVRVLSRVEEIFGAPLSIGVMLEEGTVAAMARILKDFPQAARAAAAARLRAQIDRMDPAQIEKLLKQKRTSPVISQTEAHTR